MLSKEICEKIWRCHREIEASKKLIEDVKEVIQKKRDKFAIRRNAQGLEDVFGRERGLELGVPNGENSQRIFNVSFELALPVIRQHIANKERELSEFNEMALLEMKGDQNAP